MGIGTIVGSVCVDVAGFGCGAVDVVVAVLLVRRGILLFFYQYYGCYCPGVVAIFVLVLL